MGEASVVAVSLNSQHGFSKLRQPSIHLLAGLGVQGDAHCGATVQHLYLKRKNPGALNLQQVHLLQGELFDELAAAGIAIGPGDLGENITTRGVDLLRLPLGTRLRICGDAVVELTGLRTPCKQIDNFYPGLLRHAVDRTAPRERRGRVGVMGIVVCGGTVQPNGRIEIQLPVEDTGRPLLCI